MNKVVGLGIIFACTIAAYIILAVSMPAIVQLCNASASAMVASANMSQQPGVVEGVRSYPYFVWAIPGGSALVIAAMFLRSGEKKW